VWWLAATALAVEPAPEEPDSIEIVDVQSERSDAPDPLATSAMVTVIEVDARLSASAGVASAVDQASGTTVVQLGGVGDLSAVSVRGSSLRQVEVMLDGIPLNPDGASTVNLAELPLAAFQRLELYRGNAPPALGATPLGGVVNLVTGERGTPASLSISGGSWTTGRLTGLVQGASARAPVDGLLIVDALGTAGDFVVFDDNGTLFEPLDDHFAPRDNNAKQQLAVHGRARVGDDDARLTVLDALLVRDEGIPGPLMAPTREVRLSTVRHLAAVQGDGRLGASRAQARLWALQRLETLDDRAGEVGVDADWERANTASIGLHTHGAVAAGRHLVPALTATARRDSYVGRDLLTGAAGAPLSRWALAATASADAHMIGDRLSLSPVVRATTLLGAAGNGGEASTSAVLPRLGALVRPVRWLALKGNAGTYLRPPDLTELFGDRGFAQGNPDLLPERGWQADVGLRAEPVDAVAVDLASFWRGSRDAIVVVQNAQGTQVPVNFGETWVRGVEAALTLTTTWLDSQSNLTWTDARNLTPREEVANNPLPRIPAWELAQATSVHVDERVRLGHTWTYAAGATLDATGFYAVPPRSLHGAFLRLQPTRLDLSLELSALNLLDTRAEVVDRSPLDPTDETRVVTAITDFTGYPLAGRTFMLTLRWAAAAPDSPAEDRR
jgi:vitamin B12 transporter